MRKVIITLVMLTASFASAMSNADAAGICKLRMESFLDLVKENKEVQLTVGVALQLMLRISEKPLDEVSQKLMTMLYTGCYEEMRSKEKI
jgi:hypothetical protein